MRTKGTAQEMNAKRLRAVELFREGLTGREVAERLDIVESTAWRWRKAWRERGLEGITSKRSPGRSPALDGEQRARLVKMIREGALAHGWATDLWTCARIADLIFRHFGVRHHPDHVGRILHQLGLSWQRPRRRASQRDEPEILRWMREEVPRIKKKPRRRAPRWSSRTRRGLR
jgi:transposase